MGFGISWSVWAIRVASFAVDIRHCPTLVIFIYLLFNRSAGDAVPFLHKMKLLILLALTTGANAQSTAKIITDQVKPISNERMIVTGLEPVFKMKVIRVAAMVDLGKDTTYTVAFYMNDMQASSDALIDSNKLSSTIMLSDGSMIKGKYKNTTNVAGFKIISYNFRREDFIRIAGQDAKAYSIGFGDAVGEYNLDGKYKGSFKSVCGAIVDRMSK